MRPLGTWLVLSLGAAGCVGPISDWPSKNSDGTADNAPVPATGAGGVPGPSVTIGDAGTRPAGSAGGAVGGVALGPASGGTTASGASPADAGASIDSGSADAGATAPAASGDAGLSLDAAAPDAGAPDGAVPGVGDAGARGDSGASDGGADASCNVGPDAGAARHCTAYGCGTSLDTLAARSRDGGVCATPEALGPACDGALERAAASCTQDNALGLGLGRPVTACLRRVPELARVQNDCLQCYADETLCTLSRCFVACINGSDPACEQCRRQSCGEPFSKCSGLPPF